MNLKGRNVIVTGASSGIGAASCIEFARRGASCIGLVARGRDGLEKTAEEISKLGARSVILSCDVSKKDQVAQMAQNAISEMGSVDILVNNAGFAIYGTVSELTVEEIESQMQTNYLGAVYCTKGLLSHMLDRRSGHIVNVASVAASFGLPGIAPYCASKYAMLGFSEGLYHELAGTGVGVTVVSPIMVRTNFFNHKSFANIPRYSPTSLSSETVARAVVRAASSPRLEIVVPSFVRGAIWFKQTFPYIAGPLMRRPFKRSD